jgi:hypothetical protein
MHLAHICRKRVEGREIGANWVVWILRKQGGVNVLGAVTGGDVDLSQQGGCEYILSHEIG